MSRIAAVFGATGTQGSAVVNTLLADGTFTPRAITRNSTSASAQALQSKGVQVAQADLWDKKSLVKALEGSEVVFGITNFYDPTVLGAGNPLGEIDQGKNLIDAAKEAGVKFLVWSSLPSADKRSNGKYKNIFHFENKYKVSEYLQSSGLPAATILTGWFNENIWNFQSIVKSPEGDLTLSVPLYTEEATQEYLWVEQDLGSSVLALFKNYDNKDAEVVGGTFVVVSRRAPYKDFRAALKKALGKEIGWSAPPTTGMEELDEMYSFQRDIGMYPEVEIPDPKLVALGVKFSTLEEFAEAAKASGRYD